MQTKQVTAILSEFQNLNSISNLIRKSNIHWHYYFRIGLSLSARQTKENIDASELDSKEMQQVRRPLRHRRGLWG